MRVDLQKLKDAFQSKKLTKDNILTKEKRETIQTITYKNFFQVQIQKQEKESEDKEIIKELKREELRQAE